MNEYSDFNNRESGSRRELRGRPEDVPEEDAWQYFARYISQSLELIRELNGQTAEEIAFQLSAILEVGVLGQDLEAIEKGEYQSPDAMFAAWCNVLGSPPSAVIAMAERLSVNENEPEEVLRLRLMAEIDQIQAKLEPPYEEI